MDKENEVLKDTSENIEVNQGDGSVVEVPTQQESTTHQSPAPKKSHKGLKIALIVIAAAIIIIGAVFAFVYSTKKEFVQNKWAMMTKDDTEYFQWVVDRNLEKAKEDSAQSTNALSSSNGDVNVNTERSEEWTTEGNLSVGIGAELGGMIFGSNFAGIENAGIKYDISEDKNKTISLDIIPSYKNIDIIEAAGVLNFAEKRAFLAVPSYRPEAVEISEICVDIFDRLETAKKQAGEKADFNSIRWTCESIKKSFNAEKKEQLIRIVTDKVTDVSIEKEKDISVNGLELKGVNVLNAKLSKDDCIKVTEEYLDIIEKDVISRLPNTNAAGIIAALKGVGAADGNGSSDGGVTGSSSTDGAAGKSSDDVGYLGSKLLDQLLGSIDLGSGISGITSQISGLGSIFGDVAGTIQIFTDKLGSSNLNDAWAATKTDILNKLKAASVSADLTIYVDDEGNIKGGAVKLNYNETKLKLDSIYSTEKMVAEKSSGNDTGDNGDIGKSKCAMEISLNGLKLASIMSEKEKKDGKKYFNIDIKPGGMIDALVKGASSWVLNINGNISDKVSGKTDIDLKLNLTGEKGELAHIYLTNTFSEGVAQQSLNTSDENIIDIMDLADTDYINLTEILKPIVGKLDEINDEGLNNFLSSFMQNELGIKDMDVPGLKMMVDSGLTSAGNSIVKQKLKELLGIEPPYEYSSISEKPKMAANTEGVYLYSWDVFKGASTAPIYEKLNFRVYDYFDTPDAYTADLEAEKVKFLQDYLGQTFEHEATADEYIEMGDRIVFDVIPLLGGMPIESYAYTGEKTTVGNYDYGAGIDDKLVGVKKGQTVELELTLGDDFGSFSGYTGNFRITVQEITKVVEPGWTESFIVGQLGYESVEALEKELLSTAQQQLDEIKPTDEQIKDAFFNSIIENVNLETAAGEITEALKAEKLTEAASKRSRKEVAEEEYSAETYYEACRSYGNALKTASSSDLTDLYQKLGVSTETVMKLMGVDTSIEDYNLKRKIMTAAVCYSRNITVTQAEYDIFLNTIATLYGYADGNAFFEAVGKKFGERFFVDTIIEAKVMDYLYSVSHVDLS